MLLIYNIVKVFIRSKDMYIGIDIGGTKCAVVYGDENGNVITKERFDTTGVNETLENIFSAVGKCPKGKAIGVSCGGPLDSERGVILSPPNLNAWYKLTIAPLSFTQRQTYHISIVFIMSVRWRIIF